MTRSEWLAQLKVGDRVAVCDRMDRLYSFYKITGETKTQWKLGSRGACRKDSGHSIGKSAWHGWMIEEPTEAMFQARYEKDCRASIQNIDWDSVPIRVIEECLAKVKEVRLAGVTQDNQG